MARFFLFQIKCDCGLDYIFGVNPSLTVVIIEILFSKFLSFVSVEYGNEINSNEFDFSLLNNEINKIDDRQKENSDENRDVIREGEK